MKRIFLIIILSVMACHKKQKTIKPVLQTITESVYASGIVASENQYKVFSTVSGIIDQIYIDENTMVDEGSPILSIVNDAQELIKENAKLSFEYNTLNTNKGKLQEAKSMVDLAKIKMENDALQLERQKNLWAQNIGAKITVEQKELAYLSSKANYVSAKEKYDELSKLITFSAKQAQNNLSISDKNTNDFLVKSKFKGKVYQVNVAKGELVTPQIPIAIIGDYQHYILEMQVDEYDIVSIKTGMKVLVVFNSYKDSVFEAVVTKIHPIMNLQTKTFTIEAKFKQQPSVMYPNISFEASILLRKKKNALLIPRTYLLNDSTVINKSGKQKKIKTGLKDYQMIEILEGIDANEELILP